MKSIFKIVLYIIYVIGLSGCDKHETWRVTHYRNESTHSYNPDDREIEIISLHVGYKPGDTTFDLNNHPLILLNKVGDSCTCK